MRSSARCTCPRLIAALISLFLPLAAQAEEEPPAWWYEPDDFLLQYVDVACSHFQIFAIRDGEQQLSWVGQMAPDRCREYLEVREPALRSQMRAYWNFRFERCVASAEGADAREARRRECRTLADTAKTKAELGGVMKGFLLPSWACALETRQLDPAYRSGVCLAAARPSEDQDGWGQLIAAAYNGINVNMHHDYTSCSDDTTARPYSPFAAAVLPLAPIGTPVTEVENRFSALGFKCDTAPGAGSPNTKVPTEARQCALNLFGHRWVENAEEPGGLHAVSFGDRLQVSLVPDSNGQNVRTCAEVRSDGL